MIERRDDQGLDTMDCGLSGTTRFDDLFCFDAVDREHVGLQFLNGWFHAGFYAGSITTIPRADEAIIDATL